MYSSFKANLQIKLVATAGNYAIQILEDIDKISYDNVTDGMENSYKTKFGIPTGFDLSIEVSNYNEGTSKEDLIKKVKLTITYGDTDNSEKLVMERLKVKEV